MTSAVYHRRKALNQTKTNKQFVSCHKGYFLPGKEISVYICKWFYFSQLMLLIYRKLMFKEDSEVFFSDSRQFLAHLSRRLIGELIVYPWSVVRRRRPSSTMLKHLLRNRWADQSQILCGASLGRGNDILFAASVSHDQDGSHAHIW